MQCSVLCERHRFHCLLMLSFFCRSGEKITVTPSSKELLFYPPYVETVVSGGKYKYNFWILQQILRITCISLIEKNSCADSRCILSMIIN